MAAVKVIKEQMLNRDTIEDLQHPKEGKEIKRE